MSISKIRHRNNGLLVAALGLGGLLFVGRYLAMALAYVAWRMGLPTAVAAGLDFVYLYPLSVLFAQPGVYWAVSGLGLLLVVAALVFAKPGRLAAAALAMVAVVIIDGALFQRYQPAVEARPGVTMRVPTMPGWWASPAKRFRAGAEIRRCDYVLEGWDRSGGLLYVETCGTHQRRWRHVPADGTLTPSAAVADISAEQVDRPTDRIAAAIPGDLSLSLAIRTPVLRSPDGLWDAFVARHVYGPEDVIVVAVSQHADTLRD
jgi:hypothetical protein